MLSRKVCKPRSYVDCRRVSINKFTVTLKSGQNKAKFGEVNSFDKVIGRKREKATVSHTERFVGECENKGKVKAKCGAEFAWVICTRRNQSKNNILLQVKV